MRSSHRIAHLHQLGFLPFNRLRICTSKVRRSKCEYTGSRSDDDQRVQRNSCADAQSNIGTTPRIREVGSSSYNSRQQTAVEASPPMVTPPVPPQQAVVLPLVDWTNRQTASPSQEWNHQEGGVSQDQYSNQPGQKADGRNPGWLPT